MANKRPIVLNATGIHELLQSGDSLFVGAGGLVSTGSIDIDSDASYLRLGADADYTVRWDGGNAVHTISVGAFEFDGGAIRLPVFNTTQRDALTPAEGFIIYNSTTKSVEKYEDTVWSAGKYTLPTGGSPENFLKRTAGGYVWTNTFTSTLGVGALNTTGNITIDSDSSGLVLGDDTDYNIKWDGDNAVHTIVVTAAFEFDGGAIRLPNVTTAQRDALTPADGMSLYNTNDNQFQMYENGSWVQKATVITEATDFYVATGGDDTTGDGSSGTPWATIDKALAVVGGMVLLADITINIEKGDYTDTSTLVFNHPQGGKLNILGDSFEETLTLTSVSGSSPTFTYLFNTANTSEYTVGDYVISYEATGGSNPTHLMGVLKCTAINVGVSVSLQSKVTAAGASGAVSAKLIVPQVQWIRKLNFKTSIKLLKGIQLQYNAPDTTTYIIENLNPVASVQVRMENTVIANTNASEFGQCRNVRQSQFELYKSGLYGLFVAWAPEESSIYFSKTMVQSCEYGPYALRHSSITYIDIQFTDINNTALNAWYESTANKLDGTRTFLDCTATASPALGAEGNQNSYMGV